VLQNYAAERQIYLTLKQQKFRRIDKVTTINFDFGSMLAWIGKIVVFSDSDLQFLEITRYIARLPSTDIQVYVSHAVSADQSLAECRFDCRLV